MYYGHRALHHGCAPVTRFDVALRALVADLFATMRAAGGVALAANQIGVNAQVFVIDCPSVTGQRLVAHVVNPVLHLRPDPGELTMDTEGCLSVPGQHARVGRASTATVTGVDMDGEPFTLTGTGPIARYIQHQADHLDGVVYLDRLPARTRRDILAAAGWDAQRCRWRWTSPAPSTRTAPLTAGWCLSFPRTPSGVQ